MLYVFFCVIPRHLNFICWRFGTLCLFHVHCLWRWNRQSVPKRRHIKFRCRGITQKKTQHTEHGRSLKSKIQRTWYSLALSLSLTNTCTNVCACVCTHARARAHTHTHTDTHTHTHLCMYVWTHLFPFFNSQSSKNSSFRCKKKKIHYFFQ